MSELCPPGKESDMELAQNRRPLAANRGAAQRQRVHPGEEEQWNERTLPTGQRE